MSTIQLLAREATPPQARGWHAKDLLRQVDHDFELAAELIEIFLEDAPQLVAGIGEAVRTRDAEALQLAAHSFKGSAAAIGASAAAAAAQVLEVAGREGRLDRIDSDFDSFGQRAAGLERDLRAAVLG